MDLARWSLLLWTVIIFYVNDQIWFGQIVVYPLLGKVGEAEYVAYHVFYSSQIPLPVLLPGFLLPMALLIPGPESVPLWTNLANAACGPGRDGSPGDSAPRPAGEGRIVGG